MIQISVLLLSTLFHFLSFELHAYIYPYETPVAKYLTKIEVTEYYTGLDLVDCIYVINLDKRPEKWERMQSIFAERNLRANRVSGVKGWELTTENMQELAGTYPITFRPGEAGCLLSHVSVLQDAYERGFDVIWDCEDDIAFEDSVELIPYFIEKLNEIDPDWDVFFTDLNTKNSKGEYLYSGNIVCRPDQKHYPHDYYRYRNQVADDILRIRQRYGTYSMIISRKGIKKMLDYFTHVYLWGAIDNDMHFVPKIREYCPTWEVVSIFFDNNISDIR